MIIAGITADQIEQLVIERMGVAYTQYAQVIAELNDLRSGKSVTIPIDMDHARAMVLVGQHYIDQEHTRVFNIIKG